MDKQTVHIKSLFQKLADDSISLEERLLLLNTIERAQANDLPNENDIAFDQEDTTLKMTGNEAHNIFNNIIQHIPEVANTNVVPFWKRTWVKVAAAIIPMAGIGLMYKLSMGESRIITYHNNASTIKLVALQDGTSIYLKQKSTLRLHEDFLSRSEREIWMEGEAFFNVQQHANKPFIIHANEDLNVHVLGTSFNVNTNNGHPYVVLSSGAVKVTNKQTSKVLSPGDMAYLKDGELLVNKKIDTLYYTAWKDHLMAFHGTSLQEVLHQVAQHYGYSVTFTGSKMRKELFTGYLSTNNLQQVLSTLEQTFNIKTTVKDQQIIVNN
ncbi:FecR family protein [Chitinophaga skermanii]|uniref:FecR family protein n=1 Tax=Chitinophaga skermanii TaxID=331697 RepID=A0A327R6I1_9BACT|nr:FecR domain-containing protein [Chitinophaga skermanii]RAJ11193.1 FecR family protein [Chitinophaga skermanii]